MPVVRMHVPLPLHWPCTPCPRADPAPAAESARAGAPAAQPRAVRGPAEAALGGPRWGAKP